MWIELHVEPDDALDDCVTAAMRIASKLSLDYQNAPSNMVGVEFTFNDAAYRCTRNSCIPKGSPVDR